MLLVSWLNGFSRSLRGWRRRDRSKTRRGALACHVSTTALVEVQRLETRTLLAAIAWDGGVSGTGTNWNDPANWVGDVKPGVADDAIVGAAFSGVTIISTANESVNSITSEAALRFNAGTMTVATNTNLVRGLTLAGGTLSGGTVNAGSGTNSIFATTSGGTLSGVTVNGNLDAEPTLINRKDTVAYLEAAAVAIKAVTACQPIKMPRAKYEAWKELDIVFYK